MRSTYTYPCQLLRYLLISLAWVALLGVNQAQAEQLCQDTVSNAQIGTLTDSRGATRNYRNNEDCSFTIQANPGESITLSFSAFDLETNFDFLSVYDGTSTAGTLLGRFTGSSAPSDMVANSGNMFVRMTTDFSVTRSGFVASWGITIASSCPDQTVADSFTNVAYDGNTGTQNWLSDWIEIGEADGPSAGISRVNNSNCTNANCLRLGEPSGQSTWNNRGIYRAVDLAGTTQATLEFTYRTGHSRGSQTVDLEISDNAGASWTRLADYRVNQTSFTGVAQSFDITAFATADTRIRFISDGNNARAGFYVDDISITYSPTCLPTALAEWRFDEPSWSGSNVAEDQFGGTLNGQPQGNVDTVSGGQICRAGSFDGVNDYIEVNGLNGHLAGTATLSFWIQTTQTGNDTAWRAPGVSGIEQAGGTDDIFWGYIRRFGSMGLVTGNLDPGYSVPSISDNLWHHVLHSRDAANGLLKTYIDGILINTTTGATGTIGPTFSSLGRIEDTGGTPEYLRGTLDEVIIFAGTLTDAEVLAVYDNQRVGDNWDGTPRTCPADGVSHLRIEHDGSGIHCAEELVTVQALDATDTLVANYSEQITLDTQTGLGTWRLVNGDGTLIDAISDDGQAIYQFASTDGGDAVFALAYTSGTPSLNLAMQQISDPSIADDDSEGPLVFAPSGFTVTNTPLSNPPPGTINSPIPTQRAGTDFAVHIAAFGTTPTDPSCGVIESYAGTKAIKFWLDHIDATSGPISATIDAAVIATSAGAASAENVVFNAGQATVTAKYKDAGAIQINVRDDTSFANTLDGATNPFVVQPDYLEVSTVTTTGLVPNPAASDMSGPGFVASGTPFRVVVTARDAEGDITPNFGLENSPESVRIFSDQLVAPSGGRNGSTGDVINGTAFTRTGSGEHTATNVIFDEVGIIRLRAQIADDSYLNTGTVANPISNNVGRFFPNSFALQLGNLGAACNGFTYSGQDALSVSLTIDALNVGGAQVQNYDTGLLGSALTATLVWSAENSNNGTELGGRLNVAASSWSGGRYALSDPSATFTRLASPEGPFDDLILGVAVNDSLDSVTLDGHNLNASTTGDCTASNDCTAQQIGGSTRIRYGRMLLGAGTAPEFENLDLPLRAEYWDGSAFRLHTLDSCSTYQASSVTLSNYLDNLDPGETVPLAPGTAQALSNGRPSPQSFLLSAPGIGNDGSVLAETNVSPWLRFNWLGTGDVNPLERQTFGHYRGHDAVIYWDEVTRD